MGSKKVQILAGVAILVVAAAAAGWGPGSQALRVGTGYAAKRLCSEVYLAGRDAQEVWDVDLDLLPTALMSWSMDEAEKTATVSGLGVISASAAWRPGLGCALTNGTTVEAVRAMGFEDAPAPPLPKDRPWPEGDGPIGELPEGVDASKLEAALDFAFAEPEPERLRRTRAVAVVYDGQLVAERYAEGFDRDMPLLSWSMGKSVTNTMIGVLVRQGKLDIEAPAPIEQWSGEGDPRGEITTDALLRMSSGLGFDETYGAFGDVTDMLFVAHDAAARGAASPLAHEIGSHWSYSSADTNLLSRVVRNVINDDSAYHRFPRREIFDPIGARSAIFETDPSGTFVGSSFVYMTARDWARFGQLYLQDGVWNGQRILPEGWVEYSCTVTPNTPKGEYGAQWWLNRGEPAGSDNRLYPSAPADACMAQGYETQRVVFIPSRKAVIVRIGLTRERGAFDTDAFLAKVLEALPAPE